AHLRHRSVLLNLVSQTRQSPCRDCVLSARPAASTSASGERGVTYTRRPRSRGTQRTRTGMSLRFAINGFGRVGRALLRAAWQRPEIELAAVNDVVPAA